MTRAIGRGAPVALALLLAACAAQPAPPPPSSGASPKSATPPSTSFEDVAGASGLDFTHYTGATGRYFFPEIMGSGCALLDYDNDGDLDVYLVQGALLDPGKKYKDSLFPPKGSLPPRNRLFRNELISKNGRGGKLRFVDVTEESGAGDTGYGMGVATGDYDNDGDVDIYVTNFGPDVLLRNNGDGTFTDVTRAAGLGDARWDTSATFFDYDGDGFLDLFVTAYCNFTLENHHECHLKSGARDYCGPEACAAVPGQLYHNLGNGKFENVTSGMGIDLAYGHGLGVVAGDFDADDRPDLYVANDGDQNQLWMNSPDRFTDEAAMSGAAFNEFGQPEAGMGIAIDDYDDDGDLDLFLTHLTGESNQLYQNDGMGFFEDVATSRGLARSSVAFTGFGVGWFDADHDGDLDLYIANGAVKLDEADAGEPRSYGEKNLLMIQGPGHEYTEADSSWGKALDLSETSRGAAFGDVDNDGDTDILVTNNNGPVRLLLNELQNKANWITLRVLDARRHRDAIGAVVTVALSDGRVLTRHVHTDGSYLSASDPRVHFAWASNVKMLSLTVKLPGREPETIHGVVPGKITTIEAAAAVAGPEP